MRTRRLALTLAPLVIALLATGLNAAPSSGLYAGFPTVEVYIDGTGYAGYPPAILVDGTTYTPLRALVESLGGQVTWSDSLQRAIAENTALHALRNENGRLQRELA